MIYSNIVYKTKTATYKSIVTHLTACANSFIPPLYTYVNIEQYAKKIFDKSITFEAWDNNTLVGMAAVYYNNYDSKIGFITNLSILDAYQSGGIGSKLLENVFNYGRNNGFIRVLLEANTNNTKAINFYIKNGCLEIEKKQNCTILAYEL